MSDLGRFKHQKRLIDCRLLDFGAEFPLVPSLLAYQTPPSSKMNFLLTDLQSQILTKPPGNQTFHVSSSLPLLFKM